MEEYQPVRFVGTPTAISHEDREGGVVCRRPGGGGFELGDEAFRDPNIRAAIRAGHLANKKLADIANEVPSIGPDGKVSTLLALMPPDERRLLDDIDQDPSAVAAIRAATLASIDRYDELQLARRKNALPIDCAVKEPAKTTAVVVGMAVGGDSQLVATVRPY